MCGKCKEFFKTKQDLQAHIAACSSDPNLAGDQALSDNVSLVDKLINLTLGHFHVLTAKCFPFSDSKSTFWSPHAYANRENEIDDCNFIEKDFIR